MEKSNIISIDVNLLSEEALREIGLSYIDAERRGKIEKSDIKISQICVNKMFQIRNEKS